MPVGCSLPLPVAVAVAVAVAVIQVDPGTAGSGGPAPGTGAGRHLISAQASGPASLAESIFQPANVSRELLSRQWILYGPRMSETSIREISLPNAPRSILDRQPGSGKFPCQMLLSASWIAHLDQPGSLPLPLPLPLPVAVAVAGSGSPLPLPLLLPLPRPVAVAVAVIQVDPGTAGSGGPAPGTGAGRHLIPAQASGPASLAESIFQPANVSRELLSRERIFYGPEMSGTWITGF